MKILIFGTGIIYERYKYLFARMEVIALLDNDAAKQGRQIDGRAIKSVEEGMKLPHERIFILSTTHADKMRKQLLKLGVKEEIIFDVWDLKRGMKGVIPETVEDGNQEEIKTSDKKAVVIVPYLPLGGGPIAMVALARCLKKEGYEVTVISWLDGALRKEIEKIGIGIKIDPFLCCKDVDDIAREENPRIIIMADGIHVLHMLRRTKNRIVTMLWLHAGECAYMGMGRDLFEEINLENVCVYSVGRLPAAAFGKRFPGAIVKTLRYGVEDFEGSRSAKAHHPYTFALIGLYQSIKAQDLFLEAVEKLDDSVRKDCSFLLIGKEGNDAVYNDKIHRRIIELRQLKGVDIRELGELGRKKIMNVYKKIDVLVAPSREDAMPTVCAEAAMNSCCVICSRDNGFSELIADNENGLVYETKDTDELARKMQYVYNHKQRAYEMGERLRIIYELEFSTTVFEANIKRLSKDVAIQSEARGWI